MASDYNDEVCSTVLRAIRRISVIHLDREQDIRSPFMLAQEDPEIKGLMLAVLDEADLDIRDDYLMGRFSAIPSVIGVNRL